MTCIASSVSIPGSKNEYDCYVFTQYMLRNWEKLHNWVNAGPMQNKWGEFVENKWRTSKEARNDLEKWRTSEAQVLRKFRVSFRLFCFLVPYCDVRTTIQLILNGQHTIKICTNILISEISVIKCELHHVYEKLWVRVDSK